MTSYTRTQIQRKKKLEARRKKGAGRTDGPRRRKGVPTYRLAKKLRARHVSRLEKAEWRKTHDVILGMDTKTGKPVLIAKVRPPKKIMAKLETGATRISDSGVVAVEETA